MAASALVSVLIPAYNETFFAATLASARAQTYANLEIVVCDDSPGQAIAAACRVDDARLRYVRNPVRRGFEGNFGECLRQARGGLVKFLNDDDMLRPDCVERLAAAFDDASVALATSRRLVIDALGVTRPDIPATTPIARVSCMTEGLEMGNVVLVNGLNLIGEPTTAMFRRSAFAPEADGIFTWGGRFYHCLADVSLWLRVLLNGRGYYCAEALSAYRIHPAQEQRTRAKGLGCIVERLDIALEARRHGFIATPAQYRVALERVELLLSTWTRAVRVEEAERPMIAELTRRIDAAKAAG